MHKLINIDGIGTIFANRLHQEGLDYQEQFLEFCSKPSGRKAIAEHTGISPRLILKWTNHADLARINGIAEEYAELLEKCGVDSVPELAKRRADNLYSSLKTTNEKYHLVRRLPNEKDLGLWIASAKNLPKIVQH